MSSLTTKKICARLHTVDCIKFYESQLPLTDPREALPHAHRVVHKGAWTLSVINWRSTTVGLSDRLPKARSTPATMLKQRSTLLPKTATLSKQQATFDIVASVNRALVDNNVRRAAAKFSKFRVRDKIPPVSTRIFGNIRITFQQSVG